ncbi:MULTISPECIES: hypothetical protein [Pseudomonas]|uniref:Uncharacterized protein n=1 Tax=Pseudomonas cedrina TaxID=651740 RepID=A0A2S9E2E2_PSECE|nr:MULTISPECIES: hypothetical protein [Pseudomonas]AVJ20991.1 hypothetical protein CLM72_04260 [Pseudomonas sp. MYb193]PRC09012.1 hypothetical protein CQ006_04695 [Pseudomonas cedrina]
MSESIATLLFAALEMSARHDRKVVKAVLYGDSWAALHADTEIAHLIVDHGLTRPKEFAGVPIYASHLTGPEQGFKLEYQQDPPEVFSQTI